MKRLWAPWRKEYVSRGSESGECIFCKKHTSREDKKDYIITRSAHSFSMLNIFPYSNGHILIAPYRHIDSLAGLTEPELIDLLKLVISSQELLNKVLSPQGYNIGINVGEAAGAGVVDHIHIHIIPRWAGDTNFMPVIGETKVMPESLESVYKSLLGVKQEEKTDAT